MGQNRWQIENFGAGQVKQSFAVRPSTRESQFGVNELSNGRILPDGSLTQAPGSEFFKRVPNESASVRYFPYTVKGEEYLIEVCTPTHMQIYGKVNGEWSPNPISGWAGYEHEYGDGIPGSFIVDPPSPPSGEWIAIPWGTEDAPHLRHVQHGNVLLILSPNHPPYRIEKKLSYSETGTSSWALDPYAYTDGGGEIGSTGRGITISATGVTTSRVTSTGAILTANSPIFETEHSRPKGIITEFSLPPGVSSGETARKLTTIWRIGTHTDAQWPYTYLGYGNYFALQEARSSYTALATWISPYYGANSSDSGRHTYSFENPEEWAGPWIKEEGDFPGFDIDALAMSPSTGQSGEPFRVLASDVFGVTEDMVGDIFVWQQGSYTRFVLCLYYESVSDKFTFINIGTDQTPTLDSTGANAVVERYRLRDKDKHILINTETAKDNNRRAIWAPFGSIPENHEEGYERAGFKEQISNASTNVSLGGSIYANGGIFRVDGRYTQDYGSGPVPTRAYSGFWTKKPRGCGPVRGFGHGPSRAAGFPDVGAVHQGRLALAGYKDSPNAVVLSTTNKPLELLADPDRPAEGPINIVLSDAQGERVRSMETFTSLFVGTNKGEYQISGVPLSSALATVNKISRYGASNTKVARVGSAVLFTTNDGKSVRQLKRSEELQGFTAEDILLPSSVLGPTDKIEQVVQSSGAENLVWYRTREGHLLLCSHNEESGVRGWGRVEFPDTLVDLIELLDDEGTQTIWGLFRSSNGIHRIERFREDLVGWRSIQSTSASLTTAAGFIDLQGREVEVFVEGVYRGRRQVSTGGEISISGLGINGIPSSVECRLPCEMTVGLFVHPFVGTSGPTAAKKFQIRLVNVFVESSYGGTVDGARIKPVSLINTNQPFTGWVPVSGSGGSPGLFPIVTIKTTEPLPFRLGSVVLDGTMQST